MHRIFVTISFLACAGIITYAVMMNPQAYGIREVSILSLALNVLFISAVFGWPWFAAFFSAANPTRRVQTGLFSLFAVGAAVWFYSGVSTAPAEGIGWSIIVYAMLIWISYPISFFLRRS